MNTGVTTDNPEESDEAESTVKNEQPRNDYPFTPDGLMRAKVRAELAAETEANEDEDDRYTELESLSYFFGNTIESAVSYGQIDDPGMCIVKLEAAKAYLKTIECQIDLLIRLEEQDLPDDY